MNSQPEKGVGLRRRARHFNLRVSEGGRLFLAANSFAKKLKGSQSHSFSRKPLDAPPSTMNNEMSASFH